MVKIILVEDEPAALRFLRTIIEKKCDGFCVIGEAENGAEALEKIRQLKPDIVISDIKMATMNGIELVSCIKGEFPDIFSIIISGYQSFEYAKDALKCGVVDYLLKPVNPNQLRELLESIKKKLIIKYYDYQVGVIKNIISGAQSYDGDYDKYFQFNKYNAVILRKSSLPSRFLSKHGSAYNSIALEIDIAEYKKINNLWIIPGRDDLELIFLYADSDEASIKLPEIIDKANEKMVNGFHTIIYTSKSFAINESQTVIKNLYRMLDNSIVLGVSKILSDEKGKSIHSPEKLTYEDGIWLDKMGYFISNNQYDEAKNELEAHINLWKVNGQTQLYVENVIRQFLNYILNHCPENIDDNKYDVEYMLNEAFYFSMTFDEIAVNVWDIVERIISTAKKKNKKIDTEIFIESVEEYIEQNLTELISLQSVCQFFSLSQTYLSRIFRKYKNMSVNEYITMRRIEKAKKIIDETPNILLKDVAYLAGYADPFYFSRVFRSVTGMPPSEYAAMMPQSKA